MAYTVKNYKTKKELKADVAAGVKVTCYQPNDMRGVLPDNGRVYLEGPHSPQPHTWYAQAEVKDGIVIKIK